MIKVVCALVFDKQRVLITQRPHYKSDPLLWEFPGGKIEAGESETEALIREIKEELSINVTPISRLGSVSIFSNGVELELIAWHCLAESTHIQLNEHLQFSWAADYELAMYNFPQADVELIEQVLRPLGWISTSFRFP